jgi:hypothetical protein
MAIVVFSRLAAPYVGCYAALEINPLIVTRTARSASIRCWSPMRPNCLSREAKAGRGWIGNTPSLPPPLRGRGALLVGYGARRLAGMVENAFGVVGIELLAAAAIEPVVGSGATARAQPGSYALR